MPLVVDSVEHFERGTPLFRSVQLEIKEAQLVRLFSQQPHVSSTLLNIIHFRTAAVNSYIAINGQKLYRKAANMILLPAAGLLPKNLSLEHAFAGYGCSWADFKMALPEFKATQNQTTATLSAGEQRMCEVYLCLHLNEQLANRWIFLDQPFLHLSPVYVDKVCEWIETAKVNAGILIVDTQLERAALQPDVSYTLNQGRITRS